MSASAGISASQIGRIERGLVPTASVSQLARIGATVGLDVRIRAYPGADALRDAGQVRLLGRLRASLHPSLSMRLEVPLSSHQDPRAWDAWVWGFIDDSPFRHGLPAEAETRLADAQGQLRRIGLKMRDGSVEHMLLVIADTPANRRAAAVAESIWSGMFPISARSALAALAHGHHPGGSALVFL